MPAGSVIKGVDGIIALLTTGDVAIGEVPHLKEWEISTSAATETIATKAMLSNDDGGSSVGGGWVENEVTDLSYSITMSFRWQENVSIPASVQLDPTNVGDKIKFNLYPNTDASGKIEYSGTAIITSAGVPSTVNGEIGHTVTLTGTGALVKATVSA